MTAPSTAKTNGDGSRFYTHPITSDQLMSVTTVLGATSGKPWIGRWHGKTAAEYSVDNLTLIAKTLQEQGRDAAVDLVQNQAELLRSLKRDAGTYVHDVQESLILWAASPDRTGSDIALPSLPEHLEGALYDDDTFLEDVVDWMVEGFTAFVTDWDPVFEASEMTVYNLLLKVAGTLDMIVRLRGVKLTRDGKIIAAPGQDLVLCVDTKTGKYLDNTVPEQLAAYRRMREALMPMGEVVAMPATDAGAVLHLRPEHPDGYWLMPIKAADDAHAWNRFRRAVELTEGRSQARAKPGKVARPPRPDGSIPSPRLADLDGEGYGRALTALAKTGCTDLDKVAAFTATDLLAVKGIGDKTITAARRLLADHGLSLADEAPQHEDKVA